MAHNADKPVIFLAFANDRDDSVRYLRDLPREARQLREILDRAEQAGLCEVVVRSNSTLGDIVRVFQDPRYRNRIGIFHYGGHANGYQLLLESEDGETAATDAGGLAAFLAEQRGLQLVFLNGCSTEQQTRSLMSAGVPVVIATSRAIDDRVATDFATHFHRGLAGGAKIREAFHEAESAIRAEKGGNTRSLYLDDPDDTTQGDRDDWPWDLYPQSSAESIDHWSLPKAVDDPLFGLPSLPEQDLPSRPYRYLNPFTREDAEVFFGRGDQIRELYDRLTAPRTAPIFLFYGQSGVGKSSLLDAGLIPYLLHDHEVRYRRRTESGLLDTLRSALGTDVVDEASIATVWRELEQQLDRPLIIFLDQVEELYTHADSSPGEELKSFLRAVKTIFGDSTCRPAGKLVLGFRKEWLAEIEGELAEVVPKLAPAKFLLKPLDRRGIIEAVIGPTRSKRVRDQFGLTVEEGLAETIAHDLLEDRDSAIAPTLQILLTKMWTVAREESYEKPRFSRELYGHLKENGILLRDFLNQQIVSFRGKYPKEVDSGLLLDILARHTTALGTAGECNVETLKAEYSHKSNELPRLLQHGQDLHLLTVRSTPRTDEAKTTRLAHDTLAPLVRERFDESDKPGQRARRILDNRSVDWEDGRRGSPLDSADLAAVERGADGTRALNSSETRLLAASREESARRRRRQRLQDVSALVAGIAVLVTSVFGLWQAREADTQRKEAQSQLGNANWQRAVVARDSDRDDVRAAHMFVAAAQSFRQAENPRQAESSLMAVEHAVIATLINDCPVQNAQFNADESRVLTWCGDGTIRVWNITRRQVFRTFIHGKAWEIKGASFSADSSKILSWGIDGVVRVWDVESGELQRQFQHDAVVEGALLDGNGDHVLSWCDNGAVSLWGVENGKLTRVFDHGRLVRGARFWADDTRVLSWGDNEAMLWSTTQSEPVRLFRPTDSTRTNGQERFNYISIHGESSRVLSWGTDGLLLWDTAAAEAPRQFEHRFVAGAEFNTDGTRFLSWNAKEIRLWSLAQDEPIVEFRRTTWTFGAAFAGSFSHILSWGKDGLLLWNTGIDEPIRVLKRSEVAGLVLNSTRSEAIAWGDFGAELIQLQGGWRRKTLSHDDSRVYGAVFSSDDSRALSWDGDGRIRLWDLEANAPIQSTTIRTGHAPSDGDSTWLLGWNDTTVGLSNPETGTHKIFEHDTPVFGAALDENGSRLLSWPLNGGLRLWDVTSGELVRTFRHPHGALGATFNGDGTRVLSWDARHARLWNLENDDPIGVFRLGGNRSKAAFSPDESHFLIWGGRVVELWDIERGDKPVRTFEWLRLDPSGRPPRLGVPSVAPSRKRLGTLDTPPPPPSRAHSAVSGASFIGDGSRVLSWGPEGAHLWSVAQDTPLRSFEHDVTSGARTVREANAMRRSPGRGGASLASNQTRLLTWGSDGAIRLWDLAQDEAPRVFRHDEPVYGTRVNANGSRFLSWGSFGIRLWDMEQTDPIRVYDGAPSREARFVADETLLLSWGSDGVRLWDVEQSEPIRVFRAREVLGARFHADPPRIVGWTDKEIKQWAVPSFDYPSLGTIDSIRLDLEVRTGAALTDRGHYRLLTFDEWSAKRASQ